MAAKARKSGPAAELEREAARLYALPLGEFTAARNRRAAELKKAGKAEESAAVLALAKPSLSAWAVNRLFQVERERMDALLAAGERARAAQGRAIAGRGAEALREALQEERSLRDELRGRAERLLAEEAGRAPGAAVVERVAADLEALALSPEAAPAAARGWLDADLDPPGFEVLAGLQLAASPPREARQGAVGAHGRAPHPATREAGPAKDSGREEPAERARREREEARRRERIERAEAKVAAAEEEARSLRREAESAERTAAEAAREAAAAARRAEDARGDAERARERSERAAERLERARQDLAAAGERE